MNESDQASAILREEHRVILRVLEVLDRLLVRSTHEARFDESAFRQCVEFFRLFADAYHHAKEEDLLFPMLEARGIPRVGGPIGVMLLEHRQAREIIRAMDAALQERHTNVAEGTRRFHEAARRYADLLRSHIAKEDQVLFCMGDRVLSDHDQANLCREFCAVGCRAFEGHTREQLVALANELEHI